MPLRRGEVRGFDFNRMVVEFTMLNQNHVIPCAISRFAKAASPQLNADWLTPTYMDSNFAVIFLA